MLTCFDLSENDQLFFSDGFFEKHSVVLYGAGQYGQQVASLLEKRGCKMLAFCDNRMEKVGQVINGLSVLHTSEIKKIQDIAVFITARHYACSIELSLKNEGILCIPFDRYIVIKDRAEYERAYSLLSDDYSKKTFSAVLNTMITGDNSYLREVLEDNEFFCLPEFRHTSGATFLDAGAYVGDTLERFIWSCGGIFNKAFCFEPGIKPFQAMCKRVDRLKAEWNLDDGQIFCINAGLGDQNGSVSFQYSDKQPTSSFVNAKSTDGVIVPMHTVDEFASKHSVKIDFIKVDIEGYEMHMLKGAVKTIRRDNPLLAVSVYHTPEHLYEIALYLKDIMPMYQFSLRQHSNTLVETTLYAWT